MCQCQSLICTVRHFVVEMPLILALYLTCLRGTLSMPLPVSSRECSLVCFIWDCYSICSQHAEVLLRRWGVLPAMKINSMLWWKAPLLSLWFHVLAGKLYYEYHEEHTALHSYAWRQYGRASLKFLSAAGWLWQFSWRYSGVPITIDEGTSSPLSPFPSWFGSLRDRNRYLTDLTIKKFILLAVSCGTHLPKSLHSHP